MSTTGSPPTTKTLTDQTLSETMDIVLNARSEKNYIGSRIQESVNGMTDVIVDLLESQEHYLILDAPSKSALQGAISLTGETGEAIHCTRPSDELVLEFREILNLAGHEDLWWPSSLTAWSFGIMRRYMTRFSEDPVPPEILLSLARFGEAQLAGASEEVMYAVLEDLKVGRYRTCQQWRGMVVGDRIVQERYTMDFNGDMVRFTQLGPDGDDECLIHELELPFYAQMALQHAHEQMDSFTAWEVRKIHYQAFDRKVDVKDLERDAMACPICLMEFENENIDDNKGKKRCVPKYDVTEDNRQPIELTCGHTFGTTCIEKWLYENDNCPLCRTTLLGRNRKLKPISQQSLSSITTHNKGEALLFYEDLEFDRDSHERIAKAIQRGHKSAWIALEGQFQRLEEIDSRLGTLKRNNRGQTKTSSPIARWMDNDWDKFATNALALREYVKDYIRSNPDWVDPLATDIKMVSAKMLHAHRQRSQL